MDPLSQSNQLLLAALIVGLLTSAYLLGQIGVPVVIFIVVALLLAKFSISRRTTPAIERGKSKSRELTKDFNALQYAFDQHSIVAVTRPDGSILQANDKFCEISGYTRQELLGADHRILNSGYHPQRFFEEMWGAISAGETWHGEILNRAKDGRLYWVDTTIVPFKDEKEEITKYISIRTDITQRKKYETTLAEAETRLMRENRALQALAMKDYSNINCVKEAIHFYTDVVASAISAGRISVWLFDEDRVRAESLDIYDLADRTHKTASPLSIEACPTFFARLETEQLIVSEDAGGGEILKELRAADTTSLGITSMLISSVRVGGVVAGFISVEHVDGQRNWELDEKNFCASVSDFLARLIEIVNRNRIESALRVIAKTATPQGDIFQDIAYQISKGLDADFVSIGCVNTDTTKVNTIAAWHGEQFVDNFSYRIEHEISGDVVVHRLQNEGRNLQIDSPLPSVDLVKSRSYISAPMHNSEQRIVGVIVVMSKLATHNLNLAGYMLRLCAARASAELDRLKAESRLTSIVESMSDFIWETDAEGNIVYCSDKIKPILGFAVNDVVGKSVCEFVDNGDVIGGGSRFFDLMRSGLNIRNHELWVKGRGNRKVCLLCNAVPLYDEKGAVSGYRGVNSDITYQKESETRTRLLATAIDQSMDGVVVADIDGTVEYVNPAYLKIVGGSAEEVIGADIANSGVVSLDSEFKQAFLEAFRQGNAWLGRGSNRSKSGTSYEEELILTPIYSDKKELVKVVIGVRDITKETMLEQQSRQSQKMQAIGTLAGGIAHDFNNILSAILGYADLTIEDLPDGSPGHGNLTQVIMAAGRAKGLVQQILAFSRQSASELQLLPPRTMTKEVMKLLRASIPATVSIREDIKAEDVYVRMDPSQYHQVVMNLVVNAGHAIGEQAGTITVSLDACVIDEDNQGIAAGNYVRLAIEDTGCGMTQEVRERVFEPFFTTKGVDEGTGMGLAAVHGIVNTLNGHICLESEPGKGSRFDVYFPLVDDGKKDPPQNDHFREGSERVLIVDDEEIQTELMQQMLTRRGYQVTTCNSSQQALDMFVSGPDDFDVVITDQNMPDIKGDVLAGEMLALRPKLPIIMCTAYSKSIGPKEAEAMGIREYLMKPITANDLNSAVAKIFEPHPISPEG